MITKVEFIQQGTALKLKPKTVLAIIKQKLKELGQRWYNEDFPNKFSPNATNVYHLQQRKLNYIKQMKRKYGHWQPFDASGKLKQAALSGANIKADTQNTNMDVVVKIKRGHATKKWVSLELVKMLKRELDELLKRFQKDTVKEIEGK